VRADKAKRLAARRTGKRIGSLLTRLKRLENVRAAERRRPIELQIGYLK
jgi:hypothetical protein